MGTNVVIDEGNNKFPAGLFTGTEVFVKGYEIYAMHQGQCLLFQNLPSMEKRLFVDQYIMDKEGQRFIRDILGITGFESGFKRWLFCKFGSLDGDPDCIDGRITPDQYNSACLKINCPGRGIFCGQSSGLKSRDVETLHEFVAGYPVKQIADHLSLSKAAVKSRVERLKEKLSASNGAALAAKAVVLGIQPLHKCREE
ncbi:LuxR C-terminal-related transcriptional regulator [uncultured Sanguibacteroides sp.]|uniref:LuxR C-terminal-related transcriptional regulator n=1 Tax=uncultured Sanguibacteroides sp. TaxID=1635151 RepID=UPI0025D8942C|nr:LuxR C-terminal-related transcriptional regulator [uncultured Sanguibacteroides sp.]